MGCTSSTAAAAPGIAAKSKDFHDSYCLGSKLSGGAFAQVRLAIPLADVASEAKAVRIIDLRSQDDDSSETDHKSLQKAILEANLWSSVKHEHILQLHEIYFHRSDVCYLLMENCPNSLLQHMEGLPAIDELSIRDIVMQMLRGVSYLHAADIVHRDIKPDSFAVGGIDGSTVKLGCFESAARIRKERGLNKLAGLDAFRCPEMVMGRAYNDRADVWSIGVLTYVFLFGAFPYMPKAKQGETMMQVIAGGVHPKFLSSRFELSECATHFTQRLLDRDPGSRPSASEALTLSYMVTERIEIDANLPSLRRNLEKAKRIGAFQCQDAAKKASIDDLLNELQMEKHGAPLPDIHTAAEASFSISCSKATSLSHSSTRSPSLWSTRSTSAALTRSTSHLSLCTKTSDIGWKNISDFFDDSSSQ